MTKWTAAGAEIVLGELHRRLMLLSAMQELTENPTTDELHDLQPLFDEGLWIFGTEYEAVDFRSNRGINGVIRDFFASKQGAGPVPR